MKNLRLYELDETYMVEQNSHEYPTVSYAKDTNKVYYYKNNYVEAYYIIEDVNSETPLLSYYFVEQDFIKKMEIQYEDGTTEVVKEGDGDFDNTYDVFAAHQFSQTGNVRVRFHMKNNWNNATAMFAVDDIFIPVVAINFEKANMSNVESLASLCYFGMSSDDGGYGGYGGYGSSDGGSIESKLEYVTFGQNKTLTMPQNVAGMFYNCRNLTYVDVSCIDASNTDTNGDVIDSVFDKCSNLVELKYFKKTPNYMIPIPSTVTSVDFSTYDSSNVTEMYGVFSSWYASKINALIPRSLYSNKTNYKGLFSGVIFDEPLDLSDLNTSHVTNMSGMFSWCVNLFNMSQVIGFDSFDTSNVTDMSWMFYGCGGLTSLDLSNFDTSNVTNMQCMFRECSDLTSIDLSSFDTSNVTNMVQMFAYCYSLTSVTFGASATVNNVTNSGGMFNSINTNGVLYYPLAYADTWSNIIIPDPLNSAFPSTWTATAVDYENQ